MNKSFNDEDEFNINEINGDIDILQDEDFTME